MVEGRAVVAKANTVATELVARAVKVEMARVVKAYKKSTDFRDEVNEVTCNAFKKGFEEYKKKVSEALNLLDLIKISVLGGVTVL